MARWSFRRRDAVMLELRRREAAVAFEHAVRSVEIARRFGVSRAAVSQWRRRWERGGAAALTAIPRRGRSLPQGAELFGRLGRLLAASPEAEGQPGPLWSLGTIARAFDARWGVRYSRAGLWRALRARGFFWRPPARAGRSAGGDVVEVRLARGWVHRRQVYPPDPRTATARPRSRTRRRTKGRRGGGLVLT